MYIFDLILTDFGSGDCNPELFAEELTAAFAVGGYSLEAINQIDTGVRVLTTDYGSQAIYDAIEAIVFTVAAAHDHTLKTTAQYIASQQTIAKAAARDNLHNYRDQTPVAMYAIIVAQRLRNLQSDVDEIETQAQAVAYFTSKMVEHAALVYANSTTEAGALMRHAFQAMFLTLVEASEYASNGSETS